ncbi:MAG: oxidoreductase-like domain-containing protein [Hyphomonadaceae bacterium]
MTINRLPKPPVAPDPQSCCQRNCEPCIFDYYNAAFHEWEATIEAMGLDPHETLARMGWVRASRPERSGL